jgi:hypothetical protein
MARGFRPVQVLGIHHPSQSFPLKRVSPVRNHVELGGELLNFVGPVGKRAGWGHNEEGTPDPMRFCQVREKCYSLHGFSKAHFVPRCFA